MSDRDEYDTYDFTEFTEEELADVDKAVEILKQSSTSFLQPHGAPVVEIELETPANDLVLEASFSPTTRLPTKPATISPLSQHRTNGILSVTDIVSPSWCELQYDYGLRQKRWRKPDRRPSSFTSAEGKEITVEKEVAEKNYETTSRGQSVHKALEREVKPIATRVIVKTDEERWALRLVNMMFCFDTLSTTGHTREIPVFGIIHDHIVVGIIDELHRESVAADLALSSTAQMLASQIDSLLGLPSQPFVPSFGPDSSSDSPVQETNSAAGLSDIPAPLSTSDHYTLRLIDNKTRRSPSLPAHEDTVSSRLQVMLYHRLLSSLLSEAPPFDFESFWQRLDLDPAKRFSDEFLVQAGLIPDDDNVPLPNCLTSLVLDWRHSVRILKVIGVSPLLQLVYRTQPPKTMSERQKRRKLQAQPTSLINVQAKEDAELAQAIQASLNDLEDHNAMHAGQTPETSSHRVKINSEPVVNVATPPAISADAPQKEGTNQADQSLAKRRIPHGEDDVQPGLLESQLGPKGEPEQASRIIGTKDVKLDNSFLETYIEAVFQWWLGERKPRGVQVQDAGRCYSCEYRGGCEWRQAKAQEFEDGVNARRMGN